jgi:beta-lactamase class A
MATNKEKKAEKKDDTISKPSRGRKKKGEIKPWSKKERVLVFWVLFVSVFASGILALSARSWKLPNLPRIKLPTFKGETIVIEGNKGGEKKAREAISLFSNKVRPLSGVYGLYVVRLADGSSYGVNEDEIFEAASLIKLPVMVGMYMEAEDNNLDLEDEYTLKSSDKIGGSGSLSSEPEGTVVSYRELVEYMGKESDNTAFGVAKGILGEEKISEIIDEIGMKDTSLEENETTPHDIGIFFSKLWDGQIITQDNKDELLSYMTDTIYEAWIPEGLPNIQVAHKFGREVHVVNDAGIVFTDDPFVLVILSKGVVEREADEIFPELSRTIYQVETTKY